MSKRTFRRILDTSFTTMLVAAWTGGWGFFGSYAMFKVHEDWNQVSWWFVFWLLCIWPALKLMLLGLKTLTKLIQNKISPRLARRNIRNALGNMNMFLHTGMSDV